MGPVRAIHVLPVQVVIRHQFDANIIIVLYLLSHSDRVVQELFHSKKFVSKRFGRDVDLIGKGRILVISGLNPP